MEVKRRTEERKVSLSSCTIINYTQSNSIIDIPSSCNDFHASTIKYASPSTQSRQLHTRLLNAKQVEDFVD